MESGLKANPKAPKTLHEATTFYRNSNRCLEQLIGLLWPNGVVWPDCAGEAVTFMPTAIAVGTGAPRTDPGVRLSRTGLLS